MARIDFHRDLGIWGYIQPLGNVFHECFDLGGLEIRGAATSPVDLMNRTGHTGNLGEHFNLPVQGREISLTFLNRPLGLLFQNHLVTRAELAEGLAEGDMNVERQTCMRSLDLTASEGLYEISSIQGDPPGGHRVRDMPWQGQPGILTECVERKAGGYQWAAPAISSAQSLGGNAKKSSVRTHSTIWASTSSTALQN